MPRPSKRLALLPAALRKLVDADDIRPLFQCRDPHQVWRVSRKLIEQVLDNIDAGLRPAKLSYRVS